MRKLRTALMFVAGTFIAVCACVAPPPVAARHSSIPDKLSDRDFWALTESVSEPDGTFFSDNFLSNERGYQAVIPELLSTAKSGGVYLGVGPEQNFPYIVALKPSLAIIFDIRRGNLHEHLLYKALMELSADRADFLSRLFSRPRPAGLTAQTPVRDMMVAYSGVAPDEKLFSATLTAVTDLLTHTHGFALHAGDAPGIEYVFHKAFFDGGPMLTMNTNAPLGRRCCDDNGTYGDIQSLNDGTGLNRGFLGSEANWQTLKSYETRNLIIPVVGDFAGPHAIRAAGQYLRDHDAVVSAFYLSNVEDWLNRAGHEQIFLCNANALPLDASSVFIFTGQGRFGGYPGTLNVTRLRPIRPDTGGC